MTPAPKKPRPDISLYTLPVATAGDVPREFTRQKPHLFCPGTSAAEWTEILKQACLDLRTDEIELRLLNFAIPEALGPRLHTGTPASRSGHSPFLLELRLDQAIRQHMGSCIHFPRCIVFIWEPETIPGLEKDLPELLKASPRLSTHFILASAGTMEAPWLRALFPNA